MTMSESRKVAIAIINHNTKELTEACLASINAEQVSEIWVIDNASSDGSVASIAQNFPDVKIYENRENSGYGHAANIALGLISSPYLFLLNSDTILNDDTIPPLVSFLDANPQVAIAGPKLLNPDGSLQKSAYNEPNPLNLFLQESGVGHIVKFIPLINRIYLPGWDHEQKRDVPWVLGAALAMRTDALNRVGGFDTDFFMYAEEIDLCKRLLKNGWKISFCPDSTLIHLGGQSTAKYRSEMMLQYFKSMILFYKKHYSTGRLFMLKSIFKGLARVKRGRLKLLYLFRSQPMNHEDSELIKAWDNVISL